MNLRLNKLFPWHIQFLGWVMLPASVIASTASLPSAAVVLMLGGFLISSFRGIEVDRNEKTYRIYNCFFLLKFGSKQKYSGFVKLYINPVRASQEIYTRVNTTSTIKSREYKAYLKKEDEEKLFLLVLKDKDRLTHKLKPLAAYLSLEIVDNSV